MCVYYHEIVKDSISFDKAVFSKGKAYHWTIWELSEEKWNASKKKDQKILKKKQLLLILHPGYVLTLQNNYNYL